MQSEFHTFLQAVRVPHAELWQSRDGDLVYSTQGDVRVLYSQALDKFVLRLHDFKLILDKSLPIISSIVGRHHRRAFFIPRGIGFSMIRLADDKSTPAIENFETILENTTNFSRGSGLDATLATFTEQKNTGIASSLMSSVSKVLTSATDSSHPNQKMARSFDEIKQLDSHGSSVVDMNDGEIGSMNKQNELDIAGSQSSDLWKAFKGEGTFSGFSRSTEQSQSKGEHQRTSDIEQPKSHSTEGQSAEGTIQSHKYHPSIDHQEIVGAQEQRLPAYEVHNSKEFLQKNLRKASASFQPNEGSGDEQGTKEAENQPLPEPEDFDDEAFTFGLLTKDHKQASNIGAGGNYPVFNEDAFTDLAHPMRKFSSVDRPFLGLDDDSAHTEAHTETEKPHAKGFTGLPILTAKGQPTLKSNIDDQPSPIPNTEKYSEPTQPEKSTFAKSTENGNGRELSSDTQPIQPSGALGQQNIMRQSSQEGETKKHRKANNAPVDKENLTAPTTI